MIKLDLLDPFAPSGRGKGSGFSGCDPIGCEFLHRQLLPVKMGSQQMIYSLLTRASPAPGFLVRGIDT